MGVRWKIRSKKMVTNLIGQTVSKDTCSRGPGSLRGQVSIHRTAPEMPLYSLSPFLRMTTALEAMEACVLMTEVCVPCIKSGKPEEQPCYPGQTLLTAFWFPSLSSQASVTSLGPHLYLQWVRLFPSIPSSFFLVKTCQALSSDLETLLRS